MSLIALSAILALAQGKSWKADAGMVAKLAAPATVMGYRIRPPKGYQQFQQPGPEGSTAFAWVGPVREDGTRSMMMLVVAPIAKGERPPVNEAVKAMVDSIKKSRTHFHQEPTENGTLDGVAFARIRWSGTKTGMGMNVEGVNYAAIDGDRVVYLWTQDVVPSCAASLKLTQASLLTFAKAR
jgi:hypothetical protein